MWSMYLNDVFIVHRTHWHCEIASLSFVSLTHGGYQAISYNAPDFYQFLWNKKPSHSDTWHCKIRTKITSPNILLHIADKNASVLCLKGIDSSGNDMPSASNYAKSLLGWRNIARTVLINLHANTQLPMLITLQPKPLYLFSMYMGHKLERVTTNLWNIAVQTASLIARFIGPTWGPSGADRTQVGPMLAPWTLLSGLS